MNACMLLEPGYQAHFHSQTPWEPKTLELKQTGTDRKQKAGLRAKKAKCANGQGPRQGSHLVCTEPKGAHPLQVFHPRPSACCTLLLLTPEGEPALVPGAYQPRSRQSPNSGSPMETTQQNTKTETKPFLENSRGEEGCLLHW